MPALARVLYDDDVDLALDLLPPAPPEPPPVRPNSRILSMRGKNRQVRWTRERVLAGLQRFYRQFGVMPLSTGEYNRVSATYTAAVQGMRPWPSFYGVLKHFRTFREAWTAAGFVVDRSFEAWTSLEDWYLREAAGFVSRKELARDLNRSDQAIHRRLYDLGLHTYRLHGWSMFAVQRATGVTQHHLDQHIAAGLLPCRQGVKVKYLDPGDLVHVEQIDWTTADPALVRDARQSLLGRLAGQVGAIAASWSAYEQMPAGVVAWLRATDHETVSRLWHAAHRGAAP